VSKKRDRSDYWKERAARQRRERALAGDVPGLLQIFARMAAASPGASALTDADLALVERVEDTLQEDE